MGLLFNNWMSWISCFIFLPLIVIIISSYLQFVKVTEVSKKTHERKLQWVWPCWERDKSHVRKKFERIALTGARERGGPKRRCENCVKLWTIREKRLRRDKWRREDWKKMTKKNRPFLNWITWRKWWWCWWSPIYLLIRLNWEYYQKIIHLIFLLQLPFFIASAIIFLNAYLTSAIPTRSLIEIKALHKTQWGFLFYCQCFSRKILRCPKTGSEPIVHFFLRFYPQYLLFFSALVLFWQLSFFLENL